MVRKDKWRKFSKKAFLAAIKGSGGIKLQIAAKLKADRQTVQNYLDEDAELRRAVHEEVESVGDVCEAKIIESIRNGSEGMLKFYAATKLKDRGYTSRQELEHSGELTLQFGEEERGL